MGNVMEFSLGLAAGSFISQITAATRGVSGLIGAGLRVPVLGTAIGGLVGSVASLGSAVQNTFGAIEKGAELNALHKRTGETVQDLYGLEKGFKAVHLPADQLGTMIFHLQKALGGFNEMGEPTKDIFAGIGLSVDDLKTKRAPEQILAITGALAQLNKEEAATAAGKIFGRGGAGDALQIARSGAAFSDAMKASAEQGALFARNAEAFEKIELSIGRLKAKFNGLFANLAEGAAPGIQSLLDALNNIDLAPLGRRIGQMLTLFTQAWRAGNFGEIVGLTLQAGFEKAINWLFNALKALGAALPSILDAYKNSFLSSGDSLLAAGHVLAATQIRERINKLPADSDEFKAGVIHADQLDAQAEVFRARAAARVQAAFDDIGKAMADAINADKSSLIPETAAKRLSELLDKVVFKGIEGAAAAGQGLSKDGGAAPKRAKAEDTNALERIGLLFFAQNRVDYSAQTAQNTRTIADLLREIKNAPQRGFGDVDAWFTNRA